jgi:hypothetical protein
MRIALTTSNFFSLVCAGAVGVSCAQAPAPPTAVQSGAFAPCPPTIQVEQKVAVAPPGWTVSHEKVASDLAQVTLFDGPPAEMASLVPDEQQQKGNDLILTWKFDDPKQAARGIWMSCAYGRTTALLERRLAASTKSCTVSLDKQTTGANGTPAIKQIHCR